MDFTPRRETGRRGKWLWEKAEPKLQAGLEHELQDVLKLYTEQDAQAEQGAAMLPNSHSERLPHLLCTGGQTKTLPKLVLVLRPVHEWRFSF